MRPPIPSVLFAALLSTFAPGAAAQSSDCLFNDGFDDVVNPCASVRGCAVAVPSPSAAAQIDALRQQGDGVVDVLVGGALVTYVVPPIGVDPAGFYIQATQPGPALFVAVAPESLVPAPRAGDVVDLRVTLMATTNQQKRATAITDWSVRGSGGLVACLAQDLSAATDVVTNLNSYESEVVRVNGVAIGAFSNAGSGFEAAAFATPGITSDPSFRLRMPIAVRDSVDAVAGCVFEVGPTPLNRNNAIAFPSAWSTADFAISGCPAPTVTAATALSANSARIDFSRRIAPGSVSPLGGQFSFDQGLAATSATVNSRSVLLATTPQTVGTTYTVSVANSVTDTQSTSLGTPNTAQMAGFSARAVLRINELNANIASGCDLVELRVVSGGSMNGIRLQERTADILTFGNFLVQANDTVVVHFNSGSTTCNPGGATSETTSTTQQPAASFQFNYDTAFDWHVVDAGLANTDNVLALLASDGTIIDAVFVSDDPVGTAAADTETQAAIVAAAAQWQQVGGGVPPGGFVDDAFNANAVQDLNGTSTTRTGLTIQRTNNIDSNDLQNWGMVAGTLGFANVGQ